MKRLLSLFILGMLLVGSVPAQPVLIPQPAKVSWSGSHYELPAQAQVGYGSAQLQQAAQRLAGCLQQYAGVSATLKSGRGADVSLSLKRSLGAGAYTLSVTSAGIAIVGGDYEGVSSAIATLSQLLLQQGAVLTAVSIADAPRFSWRGFHLDSSRHFWTVAEVERIIDLMALYKLNRFHWHLTDDQGWRIEIKKYSLLTERGAWRLRNDQDTACVRLARRDDLPEMLLPQDRLRTVGGDTLYGGYYTQQDIRHVVDYARQRGIEVMPEIDMPGHFLAAIDNYDGLACSSQTGWGQWFTTPLCPGKDRVLSFCEDVWREVVGLFPFEYVHIGGDEVRKDTWQSCPDCQQRIKAEGLSDEDELQSWFIRQMERRINRLGRKIMGWDEIMEGGLSPTATVTWWRTWAPQAPQQTVDQGNDVVLCPGSPMYFSQGEENNNIRDVYNYQLPLKQTPQAKKKGSGRVLGVQANLWTEYIPTLERAFYLYFPRIMALAELAWTSDGQRSYDDFNRRLPAHLQMLQKLGVNYRTPAPTGFHRTNAFVDRGTLDAACADPTAQMRYTTDGTLPTLASPLYTGPVVVDVTTHFALRTFKPDGRGGQTLRADFVKQGYLEPVARPATALQSGLKAVWHDTRQYRCDSIDREPVRQTFSLPDVVRPEGLSGHVGLIVSGFIDVPADGIYTFALKSDDGSWLKIDGNMVVDNDRAQSPHEETGQQALRAGLHRIEVRYWDHNGGMLALRVFAPGGQQLSASGLYSHAE